MPAEPAARAFARAGLTGRVAPFALIGVLALLAALPEIPAERQAWLLAAAVLAGITLVIATLTPWDRLPGWLEVVPPGSYIAAVATVRHAAGGGSSGYSALYLVPILWLALYGSRAQMLLAIGLIAVALVAPIVLEGAPAYPSGEWRRVLILLLVGSTLGFIVQRLVHELHRQTRAAAVLNHELVAQRDVTEAILHAASDAVVSFDWSGTVVSANAAAEALFGRHDLKGKDVFDALVPEHERPRLRDGFGRIIVSDAPSDRPGRFEADLRRGDGSILPVEMSVARTEGPDGLRIHAFVRDATARRAVELGRQEHLDDLDRLLMVARDLDRSDVEARDAICAAARDLVGCDFVLFYTPGETGPGLVVAGASGDASVPRDIILDRELSIAGQIMQSGATRFSGDLASDPELDPATVHKLGAAAAYWQPVLREQATVGVLVAYWRRPLSTVPERAASLLGLFATQASTVIERADLLARLEGLARTDALTGAANRRALDDALGVALADGRRSGRPVSVAMLDLDHFKRYNDSHGHQAGDLMLRASAEAWIQELRPGDVLARYGGEEFLAVLQSCDVAGAIIVADRLRAVVPSPQTASAGTSTWDSAESIESLVGRADVALYAAKDAGRDRTVSSEASDSGPRS